MSARVSSAASATLIQPRHAAPSSTGVIPPTAAPPVPFPRPLDELLEDAPPVPLVELELLGAEPPRPEHARSAVQRTTAQSRTAFTLCYPPTMSDAPSPTSPTLRKIAAPSPPPGSPPGQILVPYPRRPRAAADLPAREYLELFPEALAAVLGKGALASAAPRAPALALPVMADTVGATALHGVPARVTVRTAGTWHGPDQNGDDQQERFSHVISIPRPR